MRNFFRKNKDNGDGPEDFVLFESGDNVDPVEEDGSLSDETEYDEPIESGVLNIDSTVYDSGEIEDTDDEDLQNTALLNTDEINDLVYEAESNKGVGFIKAHPFLSVCAGVLILAILLSVAAQGVINYINPLRDYVQTAVIKENVMSSMEVEGVLESGNRYEITSLVAGKIIISDYEVGDTVKEGDILYKIDDTDAKLALERAQNELDKVSDESFASTARIVSTETGVIKSLDIKKGSAVSAGSQIGTILRSDGTVAPLISYVSGEVTILAVNSGRQVSAGQLIASVDPSRSGTSGNSEYDKKSSEIDVQSAQRQLENYTIKSPVSGVIVEKKNKVGDNVGITNSENPMMVVVDTSQLTVTFEVDETKAREIKKGQEIIVTSDSVPDATYSGEITSVSNEAKRDDAGNLIFEVRAIVSDPGELKAGMSVKAKIILASAKNVLTVPKKALLKSDGHNALILVKNDGAADNSSKFVDESLENEIAYPDIKVPRGCSLISVRYGISDGTVVRVMTGLKAGNIVVYDPEIENNFVTSAEEITDTEKGRKNDVDSNSNSENGLKPESEDDEETQQEIRDRIDQMLNQTQSL